MRWRDRCRFICAIGEKWVDGINRLTRADLALVMSQVNSEPRGELAFMSPARMLLAAFGDGARALMDAFGIEELGRGELDLTPGCVERARAERGDAPLAG